jgi:hypothetical protein
MQAVLVVAGAANYQNTLINVQFWDSYDANASPVFSSAAGAVQSFTTGPIVTTGAAAYTVTLTFATPVSLTGLTGHGLAINWQSDAAGTGAFINNTNLTTALRGSGSANISIGANLNPGSGYYRNASGTTNFNYLSSDARSLTGVTNGGLVFSLTGDYAAAVPEPTSAALFLLGLLGTAGLIAHRRRGAAND